MINRVISTLLLLWLSSTFLLPAPAAEAERNAFERAKASAEKGDAEAQLELGLLYASGTGVTRDLVKAAKWHRKAADQGLARAQYQLGWDYATGEGLKMSQTDAARWIRMAAEQGMLEAQFELGMRCLNGRGVRESGAEAVDWFRKAAGQGFAPAEYQIGICYFEGTGVARSIEEGIKWVQSAAERGVAVAQNKYGACYEKGEGVAKDFVQAYKWLALSAAQDDQQALEIKVSLAKLESHMTKDQIAEAQRLARDFKPVEKSNRDAAVSPGSTSSPPPSDNGARQTQPEVSIPAASESAKTGYVTVKAEDERCEVFVDGAFVGNSPAKLKLPEGPHVVQVKKAGFKDYRRELKVMAGSDLTLSAALEKP